MTILNGRSAPGFCGNIGGNVELGDGLTLISSGVYSTNGEISAYGTWSNSCARNDYNDPVVYWDLNNAYCSGLASCGD